MIINVSEVLAASSEDRNLKMTESQIHVCHCLTYFAYPVEELFVSFDFELEVYVNRVSKISSSLMENGK